MNIRMTPRSANTEISTQVEVWIQAGNTVRKCAPAHASGAELKRETKKSVRKHRSEFSRKKSS